jgi:hypothetical protein
MLQLRPNMPRLTLVPVRDIPRGWYAVAYLPNGKPYLVGPTVPTEAHAIRALRVRLQADPFNFSSQELESKKWRNRNP